jgi:Lrp/AsnC family transcriptional regulator, leucine-responsive regulatory protein
MVHNLCVDEIDKLILRRLEADGRIAMIQLGEAVGLSTSAAQRRVKALEADGTIRGYRAEIDPQAADRSFEVFVTATLTSTDRDNVESVEASIAEIDEIVECHRMFGEPDYLMRVAVRDLAAYEELWSTRLSAMRGAVRVASQMTMKVVKR